MIIEHLPLSRQLEMVFRELKEELASLASGTIFVQIRNNLIGKFGVKQDAILSDEPDEGSRSDSMSGLTEHHQLALRRIGDLSLKRKRWTHGELVLKFALKNNALSADVVLESNYNMASLMDRQANRPNGSSRSL